MVEHLNNGKPILIEDPSTLGKTRLEIETIRSHWPDSPLWLPRGDNNIEKLLKNGQPPTSGEITLLDDVNRFPSNQILTLGRLNHWIFNSHTIIATIMHSQCINYSDHTNEKAMGREVVNRLERLTLSLSLSTIELNAVQSTSYADQLKRIKNIDIDLVPYSDALKQYAPHSPTSSRSTHQSSSGLASHRLTTHL